MRRAFSWVWIAGYTEWVLRSVCAQAWFRRASNSKRNDVRFLGIRNNNHVEKRNGLVSNILLMDSEMITQKGGAFVASDFIGAAGSHKGSDPVRTVFRNTAVPVPGCRRHPALCFGLLLGGVPTSVAFPKHFVAKTEWRTGRFGAFDVNREALDLRPHGLSSHFGAFMHLSHVHAHRKRPNRQERRLLVLPAVICVSFLMTAMCISSPSMVCLFPRKH